MKLANSNGRAVIVLGEEVVDVAEATGGQFGPDPMDIYRNWVDFLETAPDITTGTGGSAKPTCVARSPMPHQVFAIGLNYRTHADESGTVVPDVPATFTEISGVIGRPF